MARKLALQGFHTITCNVVGSLLWCSGLSITIRAVTACFSCFIPYSPYVNLHHCTTIQLHCRSPRWPLLYVQCLSVSQVALTKQVQSWWDTGEITEIGECTPPAQPSRIDSLTVVEPGKIKRGKGGTQVHTVSLRGIRGVELINIPGSFYSFP